MSGKRSRNKGARGERQVADIINARASFSAERMGRNGITAEDVKHNLPGLHIECKYQEVWCLPAWLKQAEGDCPADRVPVVAFRKNHHPWRVVLGLEEFLTILERGLKSGAA